MNGINMLQQVNDVRVQYNLGHVNKEELISELNKIGESFNLKTDTIFVDHWMSIIIKPNIIKLDNGMIAEVIEKEVINLAGNSIKYILFKVDGMELWYKDIKDKMNKEDQIKIEALINRIGEENTSTSESWVK